MRVPRAIMDMDITNMDTMASFTLGSFLMRKMHMTLFNLRQPKRSTSEPPF